MKKQLLTIAALAIIVLKVDGQTTNNSVNDMFKADAGKFKADSTRKADSIKTANANSQPFSFADFSWLNGNNRQSSKLLDNAYFTGDFTFDLNYTRSNNNPIDNTVAGSTALARNNEIDVNYIAIGGDFHYDHIRGRIMTQFGTRATEVARNDYSAYKGQYDLPDAYRYLSEAYAGYHFDTWHGINVDMGIFQSYIGLLSYNSFENWSYQPSYLSDNTPWFFNGIRIQMFPSVKTKLEVWIINGWQSYANFNKLPGLGFSYTHSPNGSVKIVSNNYFGTDVAGAPGVKRYHTDNSVQYLYFDALDKKGSGIKRAAFSLTGDFGFQNGTAPGGVVYQPFGKNASNMIGLMAYNRLWYGEGMKWGTTIGGGFISNPSRYLALVPPGLATDSFLAASTPGAKMSGWDASATVDYSPNQFLTLRMEFVHRFMNIPYFNGPGGVSGPTGYTANPATSFNPNSYIPNPVNITNAQGQSVPNPNFVPFDLVHSETRVILALIARF
ncbi:outer membrane beta-barrel protein [Mucilaginibacter sp.]|uniref:outer membrane beta-barrel protein n=1 Tax=Mucilaginibacter sp. TaxID=1882438 RepID=UPI003D09D880